MVMTDNDDKLIASFFERHAIDELPDNGFSERVMSRLPSSGYSRPIAVNSICNAVCAVACAVLFLCLDGIGMVRQMLVDLLADLLGSVVSINLNAASIVVVVVSVITLSCLAIYNMLVTDERVEAWH